MHQFDHEMEIVDGCQSQRCDLFGFEKMVDVGGRISGAG
jgi:hypothetical protein